MRIRLLALVCLAALAAAAPAGAGHRTADFTASGTIAAPSPQSRTLGGVTELTSRCDAGGPTQGLDGVWIKLPAGSAGHAATLAAASPNNVDGWFYGDGCVIIRPDDHPDAFSLAGGSGTKSGRVPSGARWIVVTLYQGAAANFTLTVSSSG